MIANVSPTDRMRRNGRCDTLDIKGMKILQHNHASNVIGSIEEFDMD